MGNSQECVVWNSLKGMKLSSRSHYDDLMKAGIKHNSIVSFIAFVPHDVDIPVFMDYFYHSQIVSTNFGRFFLADVIKEDYNAQERQQQGTAGQETKQATQAGLNC